MLPDREGLFHAYPVEIGIGETKEKKLLQVVILLRLTEELVDGQWTDCSGESMEISAYVCLERKDHSLNEFNIGSLKAALGWDGRDPFWLQDNAQDLAQKPVQAKLGFEEYEGQKSIKVQFLNPYGSQRGGVPRADDDMRRNVGTRLGSKFRALAGGTPANPPKPAVKPTAPTPTTPKPAAPPAAPPPAAAVSQAPSPQATATMEEAWAEFTNHCTGEKWTQEAVEREWYRVLAQLFGERKVEELTPQDWAVMRVQLPSDSIPF